MTKALSDIVRLTQDVLDDIESITKDKINETDGDEYVTNEYGEEEEPGIVEDGEGNDADDESGEVYTRAQVAQAWNDGRDATLEALSEALGEVNDL